MSGFPDYLDLALSHVDTTDDRLGAHLAAVITKGGSVVSVGRNRARMNSYVMYYGDHDGTASVHAEIDAIFRARRKIDLTGCKMYVARKTKRGQIGLAAPCGMCTRTIGRYGIKRVYYTVDDTSWAVMRVNSVDQRKGPRR